MKSTCTASRGDSTRPVPVFSRMPVFKSLVVVAQHAATFGDQGQPILAGVGTAGQRLGQTRLSPNSLRITRTGE